MVRTRLKRFAFLLTAMVVVVTGGLWFGARQQRQAAASLEQQLEGAGTRVAPGLLPRDRLPPPVAHYLQWAMPAGIELETVRLQQEGSLRTDAKSDRWMAFTATHFVAPSTIGFVWNARVRVGPLLHLRVRDALVEGVGSGQVSLMSAVTVARDSGTPEMQSGSLHRYLAEAAWYPTALRPSDRLTWTAIDPARALATLRDHGTSVSLEFRFEPSGAIAGIYTPARWGSFDGGYRQVAWEGHFRDYTRFQGIAIPTNAEVGWYVAGRWQPVWNGHVTAFVARLKR